MEKKQIPWSGVGDTYTEEEIKKVCDIMRSTRDTFTQGRYQQEFEEAFKSFNGCRFSFAVSNCTAALELAALLSGLGPDDEVIIAGHTFCATAIPFARTGAKIVWADIDPETWVVTPETLECKLSPKTKVVVAVHLYGLPADMPAIKALAERYNILLVEDCAQALGAVCQGRRVGNYGDFACFSFHTHKNITTLGEGGMLVVHDQESAKLVPGLRHNGLRAYPEPRECYWVPAMSNVDFDLEGVWPYNFCIGEVQCAVGIEALKRIDSLIEKRRVRAEKFMKACKPYPELQFQKVPPGRTSSWHLLAAQYHGQETGKSNHDFIRTMFRDYGVKVIVQYHPLYRYPMFRKAGFGNADCPVTDNFFDNMVSFPFHAWMSEDDFDYMIESTLATLTALRNEG